MCEFNNFFLIRLEDIDCEWIVESITFLTRIACPIQRPFFFVNIDSIENRADVQNIYSIEIFGWQKFV